MKTLAEQLRIYREHHAEQVTKITHFIGVPLILFAGLIFLGWIHIAVPNLFSINLSWIGVMVLLVYYYLLDIRLAAMMTVILLLLAIISQFFSQPAISTLGLITFLVTLLLGVTVQLAGHFFAKTRPAFLDDYSLIFIGPLFVLTEILFDLGYRRDLLAKITSHQ